MFTKSTHLGPKAIFWVDPTPHTYSKLGKNYWIHLDLDQICPSYAKMEFCFEHKRNR